MHFENDRESIRKQLASRIRVEGECWIWTGGTRKSAGGGRYEVRGYIQFGYGKTRRRYMVPRASYRLSKGEVPPGKEVCHKCDRPLCFNPKHLFLGTHKQNMEDAARKGRIRNGNDYGNKIRRKLTPERVVEIRARNEAGESGLVLAKAYGVHYAQIYRIVNRKAWRHV